MRPPKLSKVLQLPRPNNILRMFWDTGDASLTPSTMEESAEPVKPPNSEKPWEDGHKNQSKLFWVSLITSNPMPMLKTSKTSQLTTSRWIELLRDAEEHTEPMVESVLIFLAKLTSKFSLPRKLLMWRRKEKPNKLLKGKCRSEKNDSSNI